MSPSINAGDVKKVNSDNVFNQLLESSNDDPLLLGELPQILKNTNPTDVEELDKSSGKSGRKINFDSKHSNHVQEAELDQNISLRDIIVDDLEQEGRLKRYMFI